MKTTWTKLLLTFCGAVSLLMTVNLSGAPIVGQFGVTGFGITYRDSQGGNEVSINDANYLDFDDQIFGVPGKNVIVSGGTGDFLPHIPSEDNGFILGTISDFAIDPFAQGGVDPLLQAGGFSFALHTLSIERQEGGFLNLSGNGEVSGHNFDTTSGYWEFSAQDNGFTFSAGVVTQPVPEPGNIVLMSLGFLGFGIIGYKKRLHVS